MGFGVITAIGFVATVAFIATTHFSTTMANYDRDAHETAAHALAAAQSTVLAMHADGLLDGNNDGEWGFADSTGDAQILANALAPPGVFTGVGDYAVVGSNDAQRAFVLDGFEHSHGGMVGFVWKNRHVEIHLFGDFDDEDHAGVAQHLPKAVIVSTNVDDDWCLKDHDDDPSTDPRWTCGDIDENTNAHTLAGEDISIAVVVPHPVTRAGMGESVSLVDDDQPMFDAPVSFDLATFPEAGKGCGGVSQLTVDEDGEPLICVDMLGNGEGVWSRIGLAGIDSAGDGITNAGTVGEQFYCVPDGMPALPQYKAPNMTVQFADHGGGTPDSHGAVVPVLVRMDDDGDVEDESCPSPQCAGSVTTFCWLRLSAPEDWFCRFQGAGGP